MRFNAEASTQVGDGAALEQVRKITALGVACMEQNGAPLRMDFYNLAI